MLNDTQDAWEKYPAALPMDTILAGKYMIKNVLGQGGFGITYLAEDYKTKVKVAVKEYFPETMAMRDSASLEIKTYTDERSENFRFGMERFLEEAKVLAQFQGNKHIVGVRQYFEENATAYFVMDYIEGIDFKTYIKEKGGKLPWEDVQRIMLPIMEALDTVHKTGLVHRDVTPDNIIIANDGTVKLLDFGAARYSLGDRSRSLDVILKPGYAPKEQYVRRGKQGPYTDVYSVAACFYAALSGYLPPESLERMEEDNLVPLSARGVHLPEKAEDAILKGLEVRAEDRFQSMEEFRLAIDGEIPEPKPEPKPKKKVFIRIGTAACAILFIVMGILVVQGISGKPEDIVSNQFGNDVSNTVADKEHEETEKESQQETEYKKAAYSENVLMEDKVLNLLSNIIPTNGKNVWVLGKKGLERSSIAAITFLDTLTGMPEDAWDVSQNQNGLVMAWTEPSGTEQAEYHLYIAADGGIQASSGNTLFAFYTNVTQINFNDCFHTDDVTDMRNMFIYCKTLPSLDLSGFNTSKVTDMASMFNECKELISLNLSGFDTSHVTSMIAMFSGCNKLASLDLSGFDTNQTTDMSHMFRSCGALTSLDLSNFDTGQVTNMDRMFSGCSKLTSLDLSAFDTHQVTTMDGMFLGCSKLTSLDLSSFNTSQLTDMSWMFNECTELVSVNLSSFDTSHVTDMFALFRECGELTDVKLNGFDTSHVTDMAQMFNKCGKLTSLDLSSFDTDQATTMSWMFSECKELASLDLSSFDTGQVTDMSYMFNECIKLTNLDLSGFDTHQATNMSHMFNGCIELMSLDLSGFDTHQATDMSHMFNGCMELTSLDLSSFDTSQVTTMASMFNGCMELTSLDLSGFDTHQVTNMAWMFDGCRKLVDLNLSGFDTSQVTAMFCMFRGCGELTNLDLSGFDTSQVTNMDEMFKNSGITAEQAGLKQ